MVITDVDGRGFTPGDTVYLARCAAQTTAQGVTGPCRATDASAVADASGDVTMSVELRQRTPLWDCLDPATVCAVRVWEGSPSFPPRTVTLPITFDPHDSPPPAPMLTVIPSARLGVADVVAVHGSGFRPDREIRIDQCATPSGGCALTVSFQPTSVLAQSDATGAFDIAMPTQRYIGQILEPAIDCAATQHCVIHAGDDPDNPAQPVPLQFAAPSDDPTITFDVVFVTEGTGSDPTITQAHVHLDRPATAPVRFRWFPVSFADVLGNIDVVEIPAGQTEATFPVQVRADSIHEPTEIVQLAIMAMEGAQIDPMSPTVPIVIVDDDPRPTVAADNVLVVENDPRGVTMHMHLSNPSSTPVTVDYRTRHRSARAGADYVFTRGTATFGPGSVASDVTIPLIDDHRHERTEHFDVKLSDAHGAHISDRSARIWIGDDDSGS